MTEFGEYIKKVRESKGMTLNQLALYSGISAAQLSRIENGKRNAPKPATIKKIAEALKIDYEILMEKADYIELKEIRPKINENQDKEIKPIAKEIYPRKNKKDEKDIAKRMEQIKKDLTSEDGLLFNGEPMSEEAVESFLEAMEYAVRQTQRINKKYIPKKFREKDTE